MQLVALNANSEDLAQVEVGGFSQLGSEKLSKYFPDAVGFGEFSRTTAFKEYANFVIRPSYNMHRDMGILRSTVTGQQLSEDMPFRNFLSGRLLWDEAMGSKAAEWLKRNPSGQMLALVGSDHVKFGCGAAGRCARALGGSERVMSVLLNPTRADTSAEIVLPGFPLSYLQLRYEARDGDGGPAVAGGATDDVAKAFAMGQVRSASAEGGGVLPLADLLWYTERRSVAELMGTNA